MWNNYLDESQLLKYAGILNQLIATLERYRSGNTTLTEQDKLALEEGIAFLNRAQEGRSIVLDRNANLKPDAESVEIYGHFSDALDSSSHQVDIDASLGRHLEDTSVNLQSLLGRTTISENALGDTLDFLRLIRAELVNESVQSIMSDSKGISTQLRSAFISISRPLPAF